jgi:hypothetical protein
MDAQKIYLDSNILIDITEGKAADLLSKILHSLDDGTHIYPFSAEHVAEITAPCYPEENNERLRFLSIISRNQYFVSSIYELGFKVSSPFTVYGTLNEVLIPNEKRLFANVITHKEQRAAQEAYGFDTRELNNLTGKDAIDRINSVLSSYKYPEGVSVPRSLAEILMLNMQNTVKHFGPLWKQLGASEERMLRDNEIVGLFTLLETFGYCSDDRKTYDKGSRFSDSRHVFSASFFDVFVTRDRRLRNRAEAVYHALGINTLVLSDKQWSCCG